MLHRSKKDSTPSLPFAFFSPTVLFCRRVSDHDRALKRVYYGRNEVDVEVKSYTALLLDEVLSPFYIFQVFAVSLWFVELYYYYAVCILVISVVSIYLTLVRLGG